MSSVSPSRSPNLRRIYPQRGNNLLSSPGPSPFRVTRWHPPSSHQHIGGALRVTHWHPSSLASTVGVTWLVAVSWRTAAQRAASARQGSKQPVSSQQSGRRRTSRRDLHLITVLKASMVSGWRPGLGQGAQFDDGPVTTAKHRQGKSMVEVPPKQFGFPVTWVANEQRLTKGLKQQLPRT